MAGLFVVLEGIDGSGKSTAIHELQTRLSARALRTTLLREPTEKTDASREIRRILKTAKEIDAKLSRDLTDLFLIDRLWDIETQIQPALDAGSVVLLDRYYLSTAAYQGASVAETGAIMADYLADARVPDPDMVLFLNLPVKTALERLGSRRALDVFESEARLSRIAERYAQVMAIFRRERSHVPVIEVQHELGAGDFDRITAEILSLLEVRAK